MNKQFQSFKEFYPFYLREHSHPKCRQLHFIGTWLVLLTVIYVLLTHHWPIIILAPIFGYGFAWVGHFLYEKNKPATFKYPLYSLLADWVMFQDILLGKIKLR